MTSTSDDELLVEVKGGVLTVTLNRPKALNALTSAMMKSLAESVAKTGRDNSVRVLVISASGRSFCSGADLGEVSRRIASGEFEHGEELRRIFNPLILALRRLEKPVVAVIPGVAAGAGASLALACDLKICSTEAKFLSVFSKVGLAPDSGMTWILPRTMGLSLALEHAWLAKPISAEQALSFGLVSSVVAPGELKAAAQELVASLLGVPPQALALTKRALNRSLESASLEEQMDYEAQLQSFLGKSRDHVEGVSAFLEKRAPLFTGE